ncbi:PRC-barrel domain-containing protein [Xanthobacter autotrophicus]|uniref:PRC-barrel domain-containing protein n=1 Tax=Xanthobacter TaxID=279 RepID=UPI0024AA5C9B|nr:PRC-barrel domain-containing protein [Xanthobacter autotrophicus]MDI4663528.1 PRC-barrel domain-containing protein [Xanthobacter autotrophicus]
MRAVPLLLTLALVGAASVASAAAAGGPPHANIQAGPADDGLTPAERMAARFPQKVRVGDLVGLPLLDFDDRTLGYVREVVRTPEGGIVLVVPVGGWFGHGGRPVGVPIETVAILGRQIALLDIPPAELPRRATWAAKDGAPISGSEIIRIAITRR